MAAATGGFNNMEDQTIICGWAKCGQRAMKAVVFHDDIFRMSGSTSVGIGHVKRNLCGQHFASVKSASMIEHEETIWQHPALRPQPMGEAAQPPFRFL